MYVVPAFTAWAHPIGSLRHGAYQWMTLDSDKDQIITAFLQSVAFQTRTLLDAMRTVPPVTTLRVDGGMVVNEPFCRFM